MNAPIYLAMSALLLLPLVRAGRPLAEKWDVLIYVGEEPQSRELLQAIPQQRRESALVRYMREGSQATLWARGEQVLHLLDLAPTRKVAEAFRELCDRLAKRRAAIADGLREQFDELAKKHKGLAK